MTTVSLITVVRNAERHLEEALASIHRQTYPHIEHIVVDGESTDGTGAILARHEAAIARLIRGPDAGIYDAMNKGVAVATGQIIGFLNADDVLYPDALQQVVEALGQSDELGFTGGPVHILSGEGEVIGEIRPLPAPLRDRRRFLEMPFPHLSVFVHRQIFEALGGFDLRFPLRADYDFILRMLDHDYRCEVLDRPLGGFREGGQSGGMATFLESRQVHRKHGLAVWRRQAILLRSLARYGLRQALPDPLVNRIKQFTTSKHRYYDAPGS